MVLIQRAGYIIQISSTNYNLILNIRTAHDRRLIRPCTVEIRHHAQAIMLILEVKSRRELSLNRL